MQGSSPPHQGRGKWATSWIADLATLSNGGADGIAFEVLAAKRLLCEKLLGFEMGKDDVCSFGFKLQASYPGSAEELKGQPRRSTVESDLQVYIANKGWEVGVDFKHSSGRRTVRLSKEQIAGLEIALRTGEVDRFWFVTNATFSRSSHLLVEELNKFLASSPLSYDEPSISVLMEELGVTVEDMKEHGSFCRKVELLEQVSVLAAIDATSGDDNL